jgi:Bacterial membrane protein YfhO
MRRPDARRFHSFMAVAAMLVGVASLYHLWLAMDSSQTLFGFDYLQLHVRRLDYGRHALFAAYPHLPAWYSRELMGAPFWSNIQSFPFIPTRFPLLLVDPLQAYAWGVNLAAALAALFTYLYCRRIGLTRLAAATSGWTFAASGFFASRVMAGHLPLLEAYPALPLLFWLIEVAIQEPAQNRRSNLPLLALSIASSCIVLAGHPQLPAYALATAVLYLFYRARTTRALKALFAIILGIGLAGFVLWPMVQLVCRTTRFLPLNPPQNDISLPWGRLSSFLFPWKDGFPDPFGSALSLSTYSSNAYFWETVCYVGWMPLLALVYVVLAGKWRERPWPFVIAVGTLALILALPPANPFRSLIPGTVFRSPSRQLYLTTFTLALVLGYALDRWIRKLGARSRILVLAIVSVGLVAHIVDLGWHDLPFIRTLPAASFHPSSSYDGLPGQIGDGRIAVDYEIMSTLNRQIDDIGFIDSVMLARPYRAVLDLSDLSPTTNVQCMDGSELSARALAATATKLVITFAQRNDLAHVRDDGPVHIYAVPSPTPRASFLPMSQALSFDEGEIHQRLRDPSVDLAQWIMPPLAAGTPAPPPTIAASRATPVDYERPSSDVIVVKVQPDQAGFLRVIESFDPGWHATVDGVSVPVLPADGFALAVRLEPGIHEVRLEYRTPGATTGAMISLVSLVALAMLVCNPRSPQQPLSEGLSSN